MEVIMSENLKKGDVIGGQYKIFDIKKGGMGIVYLVQDINQVPPDNINFYGAALKTFQDKYLKSSRAIDRFKCEALTWIKISEGSTTNIVKASYVIKHYAKPFVVLEYVSGLTLGYWMQYHHKKLEFCLLDKSLDLASQICLGMVNAQKSIPSLVHRDLKPENIIIKQPLQGYWFKDDCDIVKITDFGLVKVLDEIDEFRFSKEKISQENSLTKTGWGIGTYIYSSPEQKLDAKSVTSASDIYSFGIILFEMLTVGTQYKSLRWNYFMEMMTKELPENRKFCPTKFNNKIPDEINMLIMKCLEKYPDRRFHNFDELYTELVKLIMHTNSRFRACVSLKYKSECESLFDKALSFANLGDIRQALKYFNQIILIDPDIPEVLANKGKCLIDLGRFNEALSTLDKALEKDPQNLFVLLYKGYCFHGMNRFEEAIEYYDKVLKIDSNLIDALINKASIYSNKGVMTGDVHILKEAIILLESVLKIDQFHDRALLFMGITFTALNDIEEAIKCFQSSIRFNPQNDQAFYELGRCFVLLRDYIQAEQVFAKSIALKPSPDTYYNIGFCAYRQHDIPRAVQYLNKALSMNRNYVKANQLLQYCLKL